jgi:hypothetical protein
MSEDKVRTKDSCWFVGTIYDPSELPGVSTAGPGIGRGVTLLQKLGRPVVVQGAAPEEAQGSSSS